MAKLKIIDRTQDEVGKVKPDVQGYVNVVNNLILDAGNYQDFLDAEPEERADLLQEFAGSDEEGYKCDVVQAAYDDELEVIDSDNCRIFAEKDKRRRLKRSRVTMPMPDIPPSDFGYLGVYAEEIHKLYVINTANSKKRAHKFLFGVMLLTRCR